MINFKNVNSKKLFSGIVSVIIIAGMAIQSFATNVDLEAFVKKDEYMTKYNEISFRVKNIDTELERLYKFVCTNVKTYAGAVYGRSQNYVGMFNIRTANLSTRYYNMGYGADLSQDKYLRVGMYGILNWSSSLYNPSKTERVGVYEIPGSLMKWRDGIEPAPNCMYKITAKVSGITNSDWSYEIILGPIKKMPNITSTGAALTAGYICELPCNPFSPSFTVSNLYYQTGTTQEPTSWISTSARIGQNHYERGSANTKYPRPTEEDRDGGFYKEVTQAVNTNIYVSTAPLSLSSYENIWLRATSSGTNDYASYLAATDLSFMTLTSWNSSK